MKTYKVWSLDVWGNPRDGFEVNDRSAAGAITVRDDASDHDIFRALKDGGFIGPKIREASVGLDDAYPDIYVNDVRRGAGNKPVYQLEEVEDYQPPRRDLMHTAAEASVARRRR